MSLGGPFVMRQVKLLAAVTAVLLALTGFSHTGTSGKGGGGKSRSSGSSSGGGCGKKSTSGSSNSGNTYKSNGRNNTYRGGTSGGTSGGSGSDSSSRRPTGSVKQCVTTTRAVATVRVDPRTRNGSHRVHVDFLDRNGVLVDSGSTVVLLQSGKPVDVDVPMDLPEKAGDVTNCRVQSIS
ncbi:hypothetical protein QNO07_03940 [Streptomyces sp. 549]|uniref:hypothetical protein n=1 Tax=Streptomyces sp. 549 TaxID=3049076 RepID=UPI0024C45298|nr:hypothetical protein [Streptomyces sp. 549]MDK1472586.1 hypothetical protein [Streptomyces sp. 549]